jgi:lysozyme
MNSKQLIKDLVKIPLTKNQTAALLSFIDSMGLDVFRNSTLLKAINKNELDLVPTELSRWDIKNGRRSAELAVLRQQEIDLFNQ